MKRLVPKSYILLTWTEYSEAEKDLRAMRRLGMHLLVRPRFDFTPVMAEIRRVR